MKGFRSTATATQTAARALMGRNIRAALMKARNQILVYPTLSILNVPVVHSTTPLVMKAAHIARGVKRVRDF